MKFSREFSGSDCHTFEYTTRTHGMFRGIYFLVLLAALVQALPAHSEETEFGSWGKYCKVDRMTDEKRCFAQYAALANDAPIKYTIIQVSRGSDGDWVVFIVPIKAIIDNCAIRVDKNEAYTKAQLVNNRACGFWGAQLVDEMKAGQQALIKLGVYDEANVFVEVSLAGLTKVLSSLDNK